MNVGQEKIKMVRSNLLFESQLKREEQRNRRKNEAIEEAGLTLVSLLRSADVIYHQPLQINKYRD